uniref:Copine domain-containing protein n=1 Tax=Elaeophora elaphi TaxID=1147741 RepID=A0A0R3S2L4_9BILA
MTRIRQIIALRKALKAGPLLPPISKSREKSSVDGLCSNKVTIRDILEVDLHISELKTDLFAFDEIVCLISVNENSSESSWKLVATTEIIPKTDTISIPNAFSVEYAFKRDQHLKIEICDYSEEEVTIIGATTFFVTEIVTTAQNLFKSLIEIKSGQSIAAMKITYTVQPKEQAMLLQFCGKNFPRKGLENTQIYFQMFRMEENETHNLLYTSEYQLYSSRIIWKPFKLPKNTVLDTINRSFEVLCYSRDDHTRCSIIGQFITTSDVLFKNAEERKIICLRVGLENTKKASGVIEVIKCNEISMYSFLDYFINGYCLSLAVAVDFSISNSTDGSPAFVNDVECVIRSICEPFRRHNLQAFCAHSQSYAAFGFGARIPPHFRKSQQFCLNLETDPYCQGINGLIDAFWKANAQVQPSTTAHFAHIIYHLSKLASNVCKRETQSKFPYFVLAIISKGKINDIRETVQATIFASRAPLSIIFIATEDDCAEMERLGLSAGRISYQNRRAERDMLQFIALTKFRSKLPEDGNFWELFTERVLRRIPWQMINWMMKNGHIPQDFKHYGPLREQGSSGISEFASKQRQKRINEIESFSDQSVETLDEVEYASTSDYCSVKKNSNKETETSPTTSSAPSFTTKNA